MNRTIFYSRGVGRHQLLLVSLLILLITTVFSLFTTKSNYIIYPMWVVMFAYIISSKGVLSKNESIFVRVSFAFFVIIFLYWFIGYSKMPMLVLMRSFNWIMAGVVSVYAMKWFSSQELSTIYLFLGGAIVLLLLLLVIGGRELMFSGEQDEAALVANAWYGSLYMLLSGLCLIVFLNVKRFAPRIIALSLLVLSLYLNIAVLQRGTVVLMTFAELGLILLFLIKRKSIVISLSVIIAPFVLIAFLSDNMIYIFDWLAQVVPSERLAVRFNQISMALTYESLESAGGSLSARNSLMGISWNTFTSSFGHFLFGAGEHAGDNTIIGHHSFILDTLASYGIIGGVLLFVYFRKQYQIIMSSLDKKKGWALYMQCAIVFAFYVFRSFYGNMAFSLVIFFMLLFFPLTIQLILHYQNK